MTVPAEHSSEVKASVNFKHLDTAFLPAKKAHRCLTINKVTLNLDPSKHLNLKFSLMDNLSRLQFNKTIKLSMNQLHGVTQEKCLSQIGRKTKMKKGNIRRKKPNEKQK